MNDDVSAVADRDDIAGVVDLFGAVTRAELSRALMELAFKRRVELDADAVGAAIDGAVDEYALVPAPPDAVSTPSDRSGDAADATADATIDATVETPFLAVGPAAFPSLPEGATDLPHILDVPEREVDRDRLADGALERLSSDAVAAITDGEEARLAVLADVTYDIEAWASVDAGPIRERIVDEVDR